MKNMQIHSRVQAAEGWQRTVIRVLLTALNLYNTSSEREGAPIQVQVDLPENYGLPRFRLAFFDLNDPQRCQIVRFTVQTDSIVTPLSIQQADDERKVLDHLQMLIDLETPSAPSLETSKRILFSAKDSVWSILDQLFGRFVVDSSLNLLPSTWEKFSCGAIPRDPDE